jgi:pimeloyl-ACP methyl ester carboxylesterase
VTVPPSEHHHGLQEKIFDAGEVKLNYAEGEDNGPPLLLIHGLGRRWQVFLSLIPSLSLRWHIYAVDLRGHGKSTHIPRGYRGSQYAEDVRAFLAQGVGEPAAVFGHSLGGLVGMSIAAHHPELIRALVVGDSVLSPEMLGASMYAALFSGLRDIATKGGSLEEIARALGRIKLPVPELEEEVMIADLPGNDEAYLRWWARCVSQVDPDAYAMTLDGTSMEGWDAEKVLSAIVCPTLLLQASPKLGGLMSDADVRQALKLLRNPVHVNFETLGHALYMQQPEPVLRAIVNFLESL